DIAVRVAGAGQRTDRGDGPALRRVRTGRYPVRNPHRPTALRWAGRDASGARSRPGGRVRAAGGMRSGRRTHRPGPRLSVGRPERSAGRCFGGGEAADGLFGLRARAVASGEGGGGGSQGPGRGSGANATVGRGEGGKRTATAGTRRGSAATGRGEG